LSTADFNVTTTSRTIGINRCEQRFFRRHHLLSCSDSEISMLGTAKPVVEQFPLFYT
jgi:hypothetical protein